LIIYLIVCYFQLVMQGNERPCSAVIPLAVCTWPAECTASVTTHTWFCVCLAVAVTVPRPSENNWQQLHSCYFSLALWTAIARLVQRLATGWTVRGSNPGGGEIFRTSPDRSWGPHSFLYNGYRGSFSGVKWPGRGCNHPPSWRAEVKERVELCSTPRLDLYGLF
jgi:hypothetical protein